MHALPTYLGRIMYLLTEWATGGGGGGGGPDRRIFGSRS